MEQSLSAHLRAVLAAAGMLAGVQASAGEISLYENSGFGGHQITLRANAPSVSRVGFNDRTASIVVRSGRWELCSDDNFKGDCAIFAPGQYAALDGRFKNRVSSAREIETVGAAPQPAPAATSAVELFGQPEFRGRSVRIERDASNFRALDFNDRAASLIVRGGTWEMCTDAGFRGTCRTFAPGEYPNLGYGMAKSISSARAVIARAPPPTAVRGGDWERPRPPDVTTQPPITLFSGDGTRGRSIALSGDMPDLSAAAFNDAAQSVVIESGFWEFCSDAYYRGQCRILGPGRYQRLEPVLYRSVSSIRSATHASSPEQRGEGRGDVELFTGPEFAGSRVGVRRDLPSLDEGGFSDQVGSVIVNTGQWEMCVDANYRGRCTVFGPGRYPGLGALTNRLSSLRRVD